MNNRFIGVLFILAAFWLGRSDPAINVPGISKSPVPGEGLHVLIVESRLNRPTLPPKQLSAMMSSIADKYILSHKGKKYLYDASQDVSPKNDPWLTKAMQVPRKTLPWVIIDNNGRGTSEEMSPDLETHMNLLRKFAE